MILLVCGIGLFQYIRKIKKKKVKLTKDEQEQYPMPILQRLISHQHLQSHLSLNYMSLSENISNLCFCILFRIKFDLFDDYEEGTVALTQDMIS